MKASSGMIARQLQNETGAGARLALHPEVPTEDMGQAAGQGKAKAGSALGIGIGLDERFEDGTLLSLRDSLAVVHDIEAHLRVVGGEEDRDDIIFRAVADGIGEQVD